MHPSRTRTSALIVISVAFTAVFVLAAPRDSGERDSAIRMTRGGPQRLDLADAPSHDVDVHDLAVAAAIVAAPADQSVVTANRLGAHAPPGDAGQAVVRVAAPRFSPDSRFAVVTQLFTHPPVVPRRQRPALGRAPPSA